MGAEQQHEPSDSQPEVEPPKPKWEPWWFKQPNPIDRFTGWLVVFTALLFVATIINAVVLWVTDHTLKDTLTAQKTSSERQLRAYVGVLGGAIEPQIVDDKFGLMTRVEIRNAGQTPAYNLRTWIAVRIEDPGSNPFEFPASLKDLPFSILGPGINTNIDIGFGTDRQFFDEIRFGRKILYVWGRIEYRDAFGNDRYLVFRSVNGPFVPNVPPGNIGRFHISPHQMGYEGN